MNYLLNIIIVLYLFNGLAYGAIAQSKIEINSESTFIEVDNIDNIYVVNQTELIKYSPDGKFLYRFSNKINGIITSVDVTNPLRIVLFCRESNTITFLNQQLSPITQPIDIYDIKGIEAASVGASTEGGFWIYSIDNQSAMLFNRQLKMIQESQSLSYWINGEDIEFIREQNQELYLVMAQRVIVLDLFGSYLTTVHFNGAENIKININNISYQKDGKLFVYSLSLKNEVEITIPTVENTNSIFYHKKHIYVNTDKKVYILNNL